MNSRMDKYDIDTPELKRRTEKNKDLYQSYDDIDYDKFDVDSNVSVLKNNAREIDVNQIRDMLDKKYRDSVPQRRSIDIPNFDEPEDYKDPLEDTKEYDLNSILSKAKSDNVVNYDTYRLNKQTNNQELIDNINKKYSPENKAAKETELEELINTITALELKNKSNKDAELLNLEEDKHEKTNTGIIPKKSEEEFYTGKLAVTEDDFEDFKEMESDIKSNSVFIKILVFIFVLVFIAIAIFVANNLFDLGLFK